MKLGRNSCKRGRSCIAVSLVFLARSRGRERVPYWRQEPFDFALRPKRIADFASLMLVPPMISTAVEALPGILVVALWLKTVCF